MARQASERKLMEWQGPLARHAKSGLTVARFCQREHVAVATFHYWRRKCQVANVHAEPTRAQFAPVEVVHSGSVTIHFAGRAVMEIPEPREDLLRVVIGALAGGEERVRIDSTQLAMILGGVRLATARRRKLYQRTLV